jgi:hypothetical protein
MRTLEKPVYHSIVIRAIILYETGRAEVSKQKVLMNNRCGCIIGYDSPTFANGIESLHEPP